MRPLKYGKLATKYPQIYRFCYSVLQCPAERPDQFVLLRRFIYWRLATEIVRAPASPTALAVPHRATMLLELMRRQLLYPNSH